jgi:hypothetical protein
LLILAACGRTTIADGGREPGRAGDQRHGGVGLQPVHLREGAEIDGIVRTDCHGLDREIAVGRQFRRRTQRRHRAGGCDLVDALEKIAIELRKVDVAR